MVWKTKKFDAGFNNPTGIYLNSLYDLPLISRGEETRTAILMRFAIHEMLDMAFRDPETFSVFEMISEKVSDGTLKEVDIFHTDENISDFYEARHKDNMANVGVIITKYKKWIVLKRQLESNSDPEFKDFVEDFESYLMTLCHKVDFNNKWIQDILKSYRVRLTNSGVAEDIEQYTKWENLYRSAKKKLIEANVRLVVSVSKKYLNNGMELADLIQEGNKGLIRASEDFDYRRGYKFSTFAIWWIKQAILRSLNEKSRTIHLPSSLVVRMDKIDKFKIEYYNKFLKYPTISEISDKLGIPEDKVMDAYQHTYGVLSLDVEVDEENDSHTHMEDMIKDPTVIDPLDKLSLENLRGNIKKMLGTLKDNERVSIMMRFGLDDGRVKTLGEIAEVLGVTNECIRQTLLKAIRKLKGASKSNYVLPWKDGI